MSSKYQIIAWNRRIRSHRLKLLVVLACRALRIRHLSLRLDPVLGCNLHCAMCPFTATRRQGSPSGAFSEQDLRRLASMFFPRTRQLAVGCSYEPTLNSHYLEVVRLGKQAGIPHVGLVTNGQLLDRDAIQLLAESGLDEITISLHGVEAATYEELMQGARYDRLHAVLALVAAVRAVTPGSRPALRLNYTVCRRNLVELGRLIDVFGQYGIDVLQVRPMFGDYYPTGRFTAEDQPRYQAIVRGLCAQCRAGGITLLANLEDPYYQTPNYGSIVLPAVYLYVDPGRVWRDDFDWRHESYDQYCRRTHFARGLLRDVCRSRARVASKVIGYQDAACYDVYTD